MRHGEQSVMAIGLQMMLMWPADNSASRLQVRQFMPLCIPFLLSYSVGARPFNNAAFGQGTGPVYLDDLHCTRRESRLIDCPNGGVNMIDNCRGHLDDAGLRCAESKCLRHD